MSQHSPVIGGCWGRLSATPCDEQGLTELTRAFVSHALLFAFMASRFGNSFLYWDKMHESFAGRCGVSVSNHIEGSDLG